MRQVKLWMLAAILIICGMSWMTSCTDNTDNPSGGADYRTTLFVATDRQFGLTGKPNPYVITFPTRNN